MRNIRKNLKHTPTKKLEAIIENGYRGADGRDYSHDDIPQIIQDILNSRAAKKVEADTKAKLKDIQEAHNLFVERFEMLKAYLKTFGDSQGLRMEIKACMDEYQNFCDAI